MLSQRVVERAVFGRLGLDLLDGEHLPGQIAQADQGIPVPLKNRDCREIGGALLEGLVPRPPHRGIVVKDFDRLDGKGSRDQDGHDQNSEKPLFARGCVGAHEVKLFEVEVLRNLSWAVHSVHRFGVPGGSWNLSGHFEHFAKPRFNRVNTGAKALSVNSSICRFYDAKRNQFRARST